MISKQLSNYIEFLSKRDTKNLTQKALKIAEELGELSRAILPYERAFATNHRIVTKNDILEEVADIFLCIMSIKNDIDATDEELEDMISRKSRKWAELQEAEIGLEYPIPFEFHLTVQIKEPDEVCKKLQIENFKSTCIDIGVKPIVIELQNNAGEYVMQDVMTSSKHYGDNTSAIKEVEIIKEKLKYYCYNVVREKIESVPWHPAAPRRGKSNTMPKDCYFECHFAVIIDEQKDNWQLNRIAQDYNLHKSRNIFKKKKDGTSIVMLTGRRYNGTYEDFKEEIDLIKAEFTKYNYPTEKVEVEFSIYDTKVSHDKEWISK